MREETKPTWREFHGGFAKDMTMRDHYAGIAVQSYIAYATVKSSFTPSNNELARLAYELADAMLAAREAK